MHCPAVLPAVLADRDQVRIVFGNLIRNAREAMPQGGPADHHRPRGPMAWKWRSPTPAWALPPTTCGRIMEPLYSTKARGLGLGLAIARAILEKNKGSLRVASEPGRGTYVHRAVDSPPLREKEAAKS